MILDALSRAERERRQEQDHVLDAGKYVPSSSIKEDRYKKWVFIALLVNFIFIIAILLGYLWKTGAFVDLASPQENTQAISTEQATYAPVSVNPAINTTQPVQPQPDPTPAVTTHSSLLNEAQVAKQPAALTSKKPAQKVAVSVPPVSYSNKPITQNKKPSIPVEELLEIKQNNAKTGYMRLTDLAPAQRSKLNGYEVNVHVYDENTQNSFVLINMTKYKEGDRLPGGRETVDKIVPEGVVIDFGGGRVLIERN
jgi:general secretion pathway protein B